MALWVLRLKALIHINHKQDAESEFIPFVDLIGGISMQESRHDLKFATQFFRHQDYIFFRIYFVYYSDL